MRRWQLPLGSAILEFRSTFPFTQDSNGTVLFIDGDDAMVVNGVLQILGESEPPGRIRFKVVVVGDYEKAAQV